MRTTGLLVQDWPIVLGCDASGEVVEIGDEVTKFKVGEGVFGCTRLGGKGFGTWQEFVGISVFSLLFFEFWDGG
jgi:NADPH:quinone reductase-like Zn-dependent oxidoreductase